MHTGDAVEFADLGGDGVDAWLHVIPLIVKVVVIVSFTGFSVQGAGVGASSGCRSSGMSIGAKALTPAPPVLPSGYLPDHDPVPRRRCGTTGRQPRVA